MIARPPVLVVGLGGSLGPNPMSLSALKVALQGAADSGFDTELLDLRDLDLPMYRPDVEVSPAEVSPGGIPASATFSAISASCACRSLMVAAAAVLTPE